MNRKIIESIKEDIQHSIEQKPIDDYADKVANMLIGIIGLDEEPEDWQSQSLNELEGFEVPERFISGGVDNG